MKSKIILAVSVIMIVIPVLLEDMMFIRWTAFPFAVLAYLAMRKRREFGLTEIAAAVYFVVFFINGLRAPLGSSAAIETAALFTALSFFSCLCTPRENTVLPGS